MAIALSCATVALALLAYSVVSYRQSRMLAQRVRELESELARARNIDAEARNTDAHPQDSLAPAEPSEPAPPRLQSAGDPPAPPPPDPVQLQPLDASAEDTAALLAELKQAREAFQQQPGSAARDFLLRRVADADAAYVRLDPDRSSLNEAALESAVSLREPQTSLTWLERTLADGSTADAARLAEALTLAMKAGAGARLDAAIALAVERTEGDARILLCRAAIHWDAARSTQAYASLSDCASALAETPRAGLDMALSIAPGDPRHPAARRLLAMLLHIDGRPAEAAAVWKEVVKVKPYDAIGFDCLGTALLDLREDAAAKEAFQSALEADPPAPDSRFHLGVAEANLDHLDAALAAFDEAVRENSRPAASRLGRAVCFARLGRMAEAEQELTRALALDAALMDVAAEIPALSGILEGRE
ncbi:MAG: tetratricopeptide repeat protein [Phycisphaerales bacterium]|nr:tetratricopeptide repeat protein [Phycisphaerales bacterium]